MRPALPAGDGDELEVHYRHTLEELGKRSGMLDAIFRKTRNKIPINHFSVSANFASQSPAQRPGPDKTAHWLFDR